MSDSAAEFGPMPLPESLLNAMNKLNGYDPQLIVRKKTLYKCDLASLQVPCNPMEDSGLLTEDAKRTIEAQKMNRRMAGLSVAFVYPPSHHYVVKLHKWNKNYAFVKGWTEVVKENKLKVANVFSLWGFRSGGVKPDLVHDGGNLSGGHTDSVVDGLGQDSLCFVLVPVKNSAHDGHNDNLPEDSVDPHSFFDESHEFNHLESDDDSQGYLPKETEDFGYNSDGSIRDSGNFN